ncbi:hypothetical protein BCT86_14565 [Vibrio breoganii]|nr:hypothetical protein BCT86_14565 [Vibrio breoganii]
MKDLTPLILTAESSIQNVADPRLHKALLYSGQLVIFFFALPMSPPLTTTKDQIARLEKGSIDVGNNPANIYKRGLIQN